MRLIFDFLKKLAVKLDGLWIEGAGHPIMVHGVFRPTTEEKDAVYHENRTVKLDEIVPPVLIYGFYDMPNMASTIFGIDSPQELEIQINADVVCAKLGNIPEIATLLTTEDHKWMVINRAWIYNRYVGKYRLELTCIAYQESVTTGPRLYEEVDEK